MRCWYPQCSDSNPTEMKMISRVCLHLKCRLKNCWCFWNKSVCWRTGLNSAWKHFHIHLRSVDSLYSNAAGSSVMAFWLNFCFKDLNILAESLPETIRSFLSSVKHLNCRNVSYLIQVWGTTTTGKPSDQSAAENPRTRTDTVRAGPGGGATRPPSPFKIGFQKSISFT